MGSEKKRTIENIIQLKVVHLVSLVVLIFWVRCLNFVGGEILSDRKINILKNIPA